MLQSGSLYLPMLVHFLYGVIGGLVYDRLKQDGDGSPSS
jgi:hypothetical protein